MSLLSLLSLLSSLHWLAGGLALLASGSAVLPAPGSSGAHVAIEQYANGQIKRLAEYRGGRLDGAERGWYETGAPKFEYHFKNGLAEGIQRTWFPDGRPLTEFTYRAGHEAGHQQMWNADGTIRSNYVIRDGRRYGLLGAMGCTGRSAGDRGDAP